jgi:hypothetical protein
MCGLAKVSFAAPIFRFAKGGVSDRTVGRPRKRCIVKVVGNVDAALERAEQWKVLLAGGAGQPGNWLAVASQDDAFTIFGATDEVGETGLGVGDGNLHLGTSDL